MTLPTMKIIQPADLITVPNGTAAPCVHVPVFLPGVGYGTLHRHAARAWAALCVGVIAAQPELGGPAISLTATSTVDTLRPYWVQEYAFKARYTTTWSATVNKPKTASGAVKVWNGTTYFLRLGMIPCAVPGTSPHGKGVAIDAAIFDWSKDPTGKYPGAPVAIRSNAKLWEWLKRNVISFGFAWQYSTEGVDDPHLVYFAGDTIPQRVIDIENFLAAASR